MMLYNLKRLITSHFALMLVFINVHLYKYDVKFLLWWHNGPPRALQLYFMAQTRTCQNRVRIKPQDVNRMQHNKIFGSNVPKLGHKNSLRTCLVAENFFVDTMCRYPAHSASIGVMSGLEKCSYYQNRCWYSIYYQLIWFLPYFLESRIIIVTK